MITVEFGDVTFSTAIRQPTTSAVVSVESLKGWWEGAEDDTSSTPHGTGDGDVTGLPRLAPRDIEIRGLIKGRDLTQVLTAKAAFARSRRGRLIVDEPTLSTRREVDARRVGLEFTDLSPTVCSYRLSLRADDPIRYAGQATLGPNGGIFLQNRGDAVAFPVLELNGPQGTVGIAHPRGLWTLTPTPEGRHRIVDLRNGDVWESGARVFRQEQGAAPVVLPGGSVWVLTGLGTGQAIVRRHEAWT